jgi:glycosyltransferase involved in cell wall biosynthesis
MPDPVLYILPYGGRRGGLHSVLDSMLDETDRSRFAPSVFLLSSGPYADDLRGRGFPVDLVDNVRARYPHRVLRAILAIRRLIRRKGISLVHSIEAHLFGGLAARGTGAKVVWNQQGFGSARRMDRWIANIRADAVFCNSEFTRDTLLRHHGRDLAPDKVHVVHNGVVLKRLDVSAAPVLRGEFGIDASVFTVGFLGRLVSWKRPHLAIEAMRAARLRAPDLHMHLFIVGESAYPPEPDYDRRIRELAVRLGIDVTFTSHRTDIAQCLASMDLYLHTSEVEPFGLSLAEAMAMGRPALAVAAGGPTEIIEDNVSGLLVPPADETALAETLAARMIDLARDAGRRRAIGSAARRRIEDRFSAAAMMKKYEAHYERLLPSPRGH